MKNKHALLSMNFSTASHRLRMDLLYAFVIQAGHSCYRCGKALSRETFSIEHKEPWMKSFDPVKAFFDLSNIAFSHKSCNYAAGERPTKIYASEKEQQNACFRRYYERNTEAVLARKRDRYKNKTS